MHIIHFSSDIAVSLGLEEAIFLWEINQKFRKSHWSGDFHNEEIWLSLDAWEFKFQFPFWSQSKIKKVLKSLVTQGVVKKERRYEIRREFSYHVAKEIYL